MYSKNAMKSMSKYCFSRSHTPYYKNDNWLTVIPSMSSHPVADTGLLLVSIYVATGIPIPPVHFATNFRKGPSDISFWYVNKRTACDWSHLQSRSPWGKWFRCKHGTINGLVIIRHITRVLQIWRKTGDDRHILLLIRMNGLDPVIAQPYLQNLEISHHMQVL